MEADCPSCRRLLAANSNPPPTWLPCSFCAASTHRVTERFLNVWSEDEVQDWFKASRYKNIAGFFSIDGHMLAGLSGEVLGKIISNPAKGYALYNDLQALKSPETAVQSEQLVKEDHIQRFTRLLGKKPAMRIMNKLVVHFATHITLVNNSAQAAELYHIAERIPGSSTKAYIQEGMGIILNGPLEIAGLNGGIITAIDRAGKPLIVKITRDESEQKVSALVQRLVSEAPSHAFAKILDLQTVIIPGPRDPTYYPEGAYCCVIMPRYITTAELLPPLPDDALEHRMWELAKALKLLHLNGWVHMDIKGGNIFVDTKGKWLLGDFGATTKVGEPIRQTTERYLPAGVTFGEPALPEHDWFMLSVAIVMQPLQSKLEMFVGERVDKQRVVDLIGSKTGNFRNMLMRGLDGLPPEE